MTKVGGDPGSLDLALQRIEATIGANVESPRRFVQHAVAIVVAVISFVGGVATAKIQAHGGIDLEKQRLESSAKLERQKFELGLVREALQEGSQEAAATKLLFLIKLGFIEDPEGVIRAAASEPSDIPITQIEDRLRDLEAWSLFSSCKEKKGQIDLATGICILPDNDTFR